MRVCRAGFIVLDSCIDSEGLYENHALYSAHGLSVLNSSAPQSKK
jgi:hypothetical protein